MPVSEKRLTQLHGQNKGNVAQMEEDKKKKIAVPSPTASAKWIRLAQKSPRVWAGERIGDPFC